MKKRLNLLLIICHDMGQHVGCYGAPEVRSPRIDAFAASGIRFENSFCTAPQCSPSRAALYTGRFAHANGVVGLTHGGFANDLHPGERHLAQILSAAGYETHLFGIQHEAHSAARCGYQHDHGRGDCAQLAVRWAEFAAGRQAGDPPLFAQVGFFEPHRPFDRCGGVERLPEARVNIPPYLPDIPVVREDLADLEASIASVDRAFGQILDALAGSALAGETIVLFTVDHGIALPRAKMTLYDAGIEVPLILSLPGHQGGIVHQAMVSNVDLLPTLLDLLDLPHPPRLHGRSLAPLLVGQAYTPREAVFAEKTYHTYYDPMRAVRTGRWKLIANFENAPWQETSPDYRLNAKGYPEVALALNIPYDQQYHPPFELYDLARDPHEEENLAGRPEHREIRDDLIRRLFRWMQDTGDPLLDGPMAQAAYRLRMDEFRRIGSEDG